MQNDLTIVVPTHSRPHLLNDALSSARKMFRDGVDIIVGGNSLEFQQQNIDISNKYDCRYLDLSEYEANIPQIYLHMLNEAKSKIILPLDDDDILVNSRLHHLAFMIAMKNNALVTFNACHYENNEPLLNINRYVDTNEMNELPILWNGQFQTGLMYYDRKTLIDAIERWKTKINVFDVSHDECWAMICMNIQKRYIHIPKIGLLVRKNESQSMMKQLAIFSSRHYIDEMTSMLNLSDDVKNKWKSIQLKELGQICGQRLDEDHVFSNDRYDAIEKYISCYSDLKNYKQLRCNVLKMIDETY